MSQPATISTGSDRRTIGAILHSHGYVTDAQLQEASNVQARTGKPLGQVLVEAGVITRLELASALAEQWSDSSDWMRPQNGEAFPGAAPEANTGIGLTAQRREADDGALATRLSAVETALQEVLRSEPSTSPLEHAVADLARRVTTWEPTLAELERRTEAAVDTDALESHLAELARMIDAALQRTDATADAVTNLGAKLDDVHLSLAQVRNDLGHTSATTTAELAQLAAEVTAIQREAAEREPALRAADIVAEVAELRSRVGELANRPPGDPALGQQLTGLANRVEALATRPAGDPGAAERLDRLAEIVAALTEDSRLADLQSSVAELAARPTQSPELAERLEDLSRRLDALVVDATTHVAGNVPDELRNALEELAARPPFDPALAARVEEVARRLSELPAGRDLHELRSAVDNLISQPRADDSLTSATATMQVQLHELSHQLAELRRGDDIRSLRDAVEELSHRPAADPSLGDRLWRLAERVDTLAAAAAAADRSRADESALAEVRAAVDALAARPVGDPDRLEQVGVRLNDVARQVDDLAQALASRPTEPAVSRDVILVLETQLDDLRRRLDELPAVGPRSDDSDGMPDGFEARLGGAERTAETLSTELSRTAEIWYAGRAALEARLEELETRLAARPAPAPPTAGGGGASVPAPHVIEQEVERVLMAVERLGLHLSEHDRALAELMSRRGPSKVEELAARVDELETYGVAAGAVVGVSAGTDGAPQPVSMVETRDLRAELRSLSRQVTELEDMSKTDREKFLTQLERMASSIDWRIRRIESGETAPK